MADTQTTVALNIGSQRISMALFETDKSGDLILKAYDAETILADPAMDAARMSQTRLAIKDLGERLGVDKLKARYAVSGQAVFTRFVKLPPIQHEDIEQLVRFEAQQHVPFPLDEVIWDYELIEGAGEKEAVIVAIKSDALDELNAAVAAAGMQTSEVDVAPMALYNAYRANYPLSNEPVLLIDIGAKTSNLIYIEGERFFTRSIPIGGVAISSAIAKEYGVPFAEAEEQKVTNGLVALGGGHTEQLHESVAALAIVIRNSLGRLPAEIARTTNYYRSQHGGSAPRKILLAGGGANLPYTLEFFNEKLNLPVEFFNPVRRLVLDPSMDPQRVQREGHQMGEVIGLALRGTGDSAIHIDLVPSVIEQARAEQRRRPFLIAAAVVLIAGLSIWAVAKNVAAGKAEAKAQTMQQQRDKLEPIKKKLNTLNQREAQLLAIASAYTDAEAEHVFWQDALNELQGAFAHDAIWLTSMEPISGFDASKVVAADYNPATNGQPVVADNFDSTSYGNSSLTKLKEEKNRGKGKKEPKGKKDAKGNKGKPQAVAEPSGPSIDAIRIKGFWRDNPRSQNVVSDLLKQLQEKSVNFNFLVEVPAEKNQTKVVNLVSDQYLSKIMARATDPAQPEDLAQSFEIVLPLARKLAIK